MQTMHVHEKTMRTPWAIMLVGLLACDDRTDSGEDFREHGGIGEVESNEGPAIPASFDPLEADFNGDGYADLAIGVSNEEFGGKHAGGVNVLYGTPDGLSGKQDEVWHRGTSGVDGSKDSGDQFGFALAVGDFNYDGYADLAIGVPTDEVDGVEGAGSITVLYGSDEGLTSDASETFSQDSKGIEDDPDVDDYFGYALTTGDFDHDGYVDLAVGVPGEDISGETDAGLVHVVFGSVDGLRGDDSQVWHQGSDGVTGVLEDDDGFGTALASGDFNSDGHDDLVIGVPGEDIDEQEDAGWVHVLYGGDGGVLSSVPTHDDTGLSSIGDDIWHQDVDGIDGDAESFDGFGYALAVGDFDYDGYDDLAVGVPGEDVTLKDKDAGAVNTIYGGSGGLTASDDQYWHQNKGGIGGSAGDDEHFGAALTAGDFDDDGYDDLAIGAPGEDYESHESAGQVQVLYGKDSGLSSDGEQRWHQSIEDIDGVAEAFDRFGQSLTAGDYDGDGAADLVIGAPLEDVGERTDAGAINVIYGSIDEGLDEDDNGAWHQDASGIEGDAEDHDAFGFALR